MREGSHLFEVLLLKISCIKMNVLIIGKDSYIGNHIDQWLSNKGIQVEQLDVLTVDWKKYDYSGYECIVHVAGIVHRPDCNDWELYKKVNTDMPIGIATMAKQQGVKQYVFFSTMGVYGLGKKLRPNVIDENTPTNGVGMYGKSKLLAEEGLQALSDDSFRISFVRPPSVYGKGCKGNYISGFTSIAKKLPIIPLAYQNVKQSMIYIDNLCELVYQIIDNRLSGPFCPQDEKAVSANEILEALGKGIGKKVRSSSIIGWFIPILSFVPLVSKAYGGVEYAQSLSTIPGINYVVVKFEEGMKRTVAP